MRRYPEYSIIVPAYQASATIADCVRALSCQTVKRDLYEIIVVNDGSTDSTSAVARSAGADVVTLIAHAGPATARNKGVELARGSVILFTDADCCPTPNWLAQMVSAFDDPSISGVKGAYRTRQRSCVARLVQCEFEERYDLLETQTAIDFIDTYAAAFRREALNEVGLFDPAFTEANNEDVDLSYRLAEAGHKLVFNRQAIVYHRHPASWRAYMLIKAKRGYWRMLVYSLHPNKILKDSYTPQLLKFQVGLMILIGAAFCLGLIYTPLLWFPLFFLISILISSIPLMRVALRFDASLLGWVPLFVIVRALAFSVGVSVGILGIIGFRPVR